MIDQESRIQESGRMGIKGASKRADTTGLARINTTVKSRTKEALRRIAVERRISIGVVLDMMVTSAEKIANNTN